MSALTVQSGALTVAPGDVDGGTVYCPAGQRVVSGGFASVSADGEVFLSIANDNRTGWIVALDNFDSYVEGDLLGEAYCAGRRHRRHRRRARGRGPRRCSTASWPSARRRIARNRNRGRRVRGGPNSSP